MVDIRTLDEKLDEKVNIINMRFHDYGLNSNRERYVIEERSQVAKALESSFRKDNNPQIYPPSKKYLMALYYSRELRNYMVFPQKDILSKFLKVIFHVITADLFYHTSFA